jgi:menaquinol-cytochrome c reductase iron-sulfur subunit
MPSAAFVRASFGFVSDPAKIGRVTDDAATSRRHALGAIALGGGVGCVAIGVPAVRLLLAPARAGSSSGRWIKTVPIEALPEGEPTRVPMIADHHDAWVIEKNVPLGAAWLVRRGESVRAWSAVCPHLGCAVGRSVTGRGFHCPCHDSLFDAMGRRLNGPSPRDLDALDTRVADRFVLVDFRRFRHFALWAIGSTSARGCARR